MQVTVSLHLTAAIAEMQFLMLWVAEMKVIIFLYEFNFI